MFVVVVSGLVDDVAATPGIYGFMRDNHKDYDYDFVRSLARSLNFFDGLQNELERPRFPLRSTNMLNDDQWCEMMVCVCVCVCGVAADVCAHWDASFMQNPPPPFLYEGY